ncbi:MAG: hypothetical protein RL204_511 [Bacteroidota bacterium]|jgi:hypothetical protein
MRTLIIAILLLLNGVCFAQSNVGLMIEGQMTNEDGKRYKDVARIILKKDTLAPDTIRIKGGDFTLGLDYDSKYTISFESDNKYPKKIFIDMTAIPNENRSAPFEMSMDVALITKPIIPNQQLEEWHSVVSQKLYYSKVDDAIVQDILYSAERERLRAQIVGE